MGSEILVVDDEADIRELISGLLEDEGYETRSAKDSDTALQELSARCPGLVFLDIWLQSSKLDGLEILDVIKQQYPDLPVIIISGHGNIETAVSAIKRGAYDFIEKPFKADRLLLMASRALENSRLRREVNELREKSGGNGSIIGSSLVISRLRNTIEKVSKTNARILITGPSGSGKELAGRTVHALSARCNSSFIVLNAAMMEPGKVEIELFGTEGVGINNLHHIGMLEAAHGGTLYIDEIADMPLATQVKILRVLLDQTFYRVGGNILVKVDVRIISSSSRNLEIEIQKGHLRRDLFHRLSVVHIQVPSLSERCEDIPDLIHYFVKQISRAEGLQILNIGEDIMAILQSYDWTGNVRQLRNCVERLMIMSNNDPENKITVATLQDEMNTAFPVSPIKLGMERLMAVQLRSARESFEREYLLAQINRFGGNISKTAIFIGMERSALHRKLKLLGVASRK